MCTSDARSRIAWVRMRPTTCTTGASSSTTSGVTVCGVDRTSSGALDGLEGLDEMVEPADGPVVVLDGAADLGERRQHGTDGSSASSRREGSGVRCDGWSAIATWRPDLVQNHGDDESAREPTESGIRSSACCSGIRLPEVGDVHPVELGASRDQVVFVENAHADKHIREISPVGWLGVRSA